ncbi:Arm DNA-binding domain-containing protein [Peristeroidobacter agariperforans]|uniref:Arm DNA-binding domain-containing protein n=1 Tax=Peristeroidobacter agariperforans TaxID=268404 RepID=UPI00101C6D61|nr:DUF3596 domain-containing protein [Peristeroidobacter agariperforans]
MSRRSLDKGSVRAIGKDRIEFMIWIEGKRYRPWVKCTASEANLRRAQRQLEQSKDRIAEGTFNLAEEFPKYRFKHKLPARSLTRAWRGSPRSTSASPPARSTWMAICHA